MSTDLLDIQPVITNHWLERVIVGVTLVNKQLGVA
jgi:hypothetical protein